MTEAFEARTPRSTASAPTGSTDFEARYRTDPDPWRTLTDPYESHKRERTLTACGPGPFASACDLGAGTGVLAAALAPRCDQLLALDGAPTAVAEAQRRLTPFPHAEARVARLPDGLPTGPFDLVVASEILYYLDEDAFHMVLAGCRTRWPVGGAPSPCTGPGPRRPCSAAPTTSAPRWRRPPGCGWSRTAPDPTEGFRLDVLERY